MCSTEEERRRRARVGQRKLKAGYTKSSITSSQNSNMKKVGTMHQPQRAIITLRFEHTLSVRLGPTHRHVYGPSKFDKSLPLPNQTVNRIQISRTTGHSVISSTFKMAKDIFSNLGLKRKWRKKGKSQATVT